MVIDAAAVAVVSYQDHRSSQRRYHRSGSSGYSGIIAAARWWHRRQHYSGDRCTVAAILVSYQQHCYSSGNGTGIVEGASRQQRRHRSTCNSGGSGAGSVIESALQW